MSTEGGRRYEFGPFQLETAEGVLLRDGRLVHLTPKAYETLLAFVRHQGHILSKDDLLRIVWPDTVVDENNLNQQISLLRKVLGARPNGEPYIETVPRRGYRFTSAVHESIAPGDRPMTEGRTARRDRALTATVFAASLTVLVAVGWLYEARKQTMTTNAESRPIVVLPFAFVGGASADRELPAKLAAAMARKLEEGGLTPRLERAGPRSGAQSASDALSLGRNLGAQFVIEGRLAQQGDAIQGFVHLIDTAEGAPQWSHRFQSPRADLATAADALADRITRSIQEPRTATSDPRTIAHHAYEKGRYFWDKRTSVGLDRAISYFEEAVAADPTYAPAHAGLAAANAFDAVHWPRAEASARKALELDPSLSDAHAVLGFIRLFWQWRWEDARAEFTRAIALDRRNATAHQWYAVWLVTVGRKMEALAEMTEALRLDPFSSIVRADLAQMHYFNGDYAQAIELCKEAIAAEPDFVVAHLYSYDLFVQSGRYDEAVDAFGKASAILQTHPIYDETRMPALRRTYETDGIRGFWQSVIDVRPDRIDSVVAAEHLARLGKADEALRALDDAYKAHQLGLVYLRANPAFDNIREHPGFQQLIRRIGIPRLGTPHAENARAAAATSR